jgi:Flp pilus assembly protein TadD/peroxiredoxin
MADQRDKQRIVSRRTFLKGMRWTPWIFLSSGIHIPSPGPLFEASRPAQSGSAHVADVRFTPHYPTRTPLEDLLRFVAPGSDEYITEKYAAEIARLLAEWGAKLKTTPPALDVLAKFLHAGTQSTELTRPETRTVRSDYGLEVLQRRFSAKSFSTRDQFLQELKGYFAGMGQIETAEFEIIKIEGTKGARPALRTHVRYELVGSRIDGAREQRVGSWQMQWEQSHSDEWQILKWEFNDETLSRVRGPGFLDITSHVIGQTDSYQSQMLRGADYWRTVLDGACGIDVYGNNGLAVGDFDNDGLDDFYVCQPAGLPNRLYRNRGDGTFEDVTVKSGTGVLDNTSCALFADLENKGLQDLLVVSEGGPLLFLNQGNGKYSLKRDAFKFARPPQGSFTHAAMADYDRDGRLDIYFCLYNYYVGLDQYHYPVPYFDARNGPPNFLFHNGGNATFQDRTESARLNVDNDRYSFAGAWGDYNGNGWPDLYVANDFGRSNLYRNNGDGTFTSVSTEGGVEDAGAGMSACWFDFDNDGNQEIYVANMWSAAGTRVSEQIQFHENEPEGIRELYRQHARGNSLYRNKGDGKFQNISQQANADVGRWAWSSDAWDFDHDGYPDLYIANGYISGPETQEISSFFWRRLVGASPQNATPSPKYEQGWNAINELIRSDASWSGPERNLFYVNNRNGSFSDLSGALGLDFPDDSRAFALLDLDRDGRLEVILKNRNGPQLRVLRNAMTDLGHSISFRLRGKTSNRDAIGAAITVEAAGVRQTKYLQAGTGFLSQHTKELFFGVGKAEGTIRVSIRWPSGITQTFSQLPVNHRIEIEEGSEHFLAKPFQVSPLAETRARAPQISEALPTSVETWLLEPLSAPKFSLPDLAGQTWTADRFKGQSLLLHFWMTDSPICREQMRLLEKYQARFGAKGLRILAINLDELRDTTKLKAVIEKERLSFPILLATAEVAGIYNIVYRYLFDRRRDLPIPTSFLVDGKGMIVKVYQGAINPERLLADVASMPQTPEDRIRRALPFSGALHQGEFRRNDFTYGVAFFQRGFLDQAEESFKQVIAAKPNNPEAHYNLGTLYLRKRAFSDARRSLEQAVTLRPNYPEAWNNLGMLAAQQGQADDAIRSFRQSLLFRPNYVVALLNLGNVYRRQRAFVDAQDTLKRGLDVEPENPEINYSLGMLYAQQGQLDLAVNFLQQAVKLRPDYPDALNNLGVIFVNQGRYPEAEERFKACIAADPNFDQAYLNLAHLYAINKNKEKAREVLLALLQRQPQHKVAQQELEMLQ